MYLCSKPAPTFHSCDRKTFRENEYHVTRTYRYSVLILMLEGVLRFREGGRDVELHAGEYYIQKQGLLQEGVALGVSPVYFYMEFDGTYAEDGNGGIPLRGTYSAELLCPLLSECVRLFYTERPSQFFLNATLCRALDALVAETSPAVRLAHRLKNYLDANYPSAVSLASLSEKFGYSQNHLNRVFRAAYGVSPYRYLASVRIAKAHWLLTHTDVPVHLVAEMVGYTDASAFYRGFVKAYGASPREARDGVLREEKRPGGE